MKQLFLTAVMVISGIISSYAQAPTVTITVDPGMGTCGDQTLTFYEFDLPCMMNVKTQVTVSSGSTTSFNLGTASLWPAGTTPTTGTWGIDWSVDNIYVSPSCGAIYASGGSCGNTDGAALTTGYACSAIPANTCFTNTSCGCGSNTVNVDINVTATNIDIHIY